MTRGTQYGPRFWSRPRRTTTLACGCVLSFETARVISTCPTHKASGARIAAAIMAGRTRGVYDFEEERYVGGSEP